MTFFSSVLTSFRNRTNCSHRSLIAILVNPFTSIRRRCCGDSPIPCAASGGTSPGRPEDTTVRTRTPDRLISNRRTSAVPTLSAKHHNDPQAFRSAVGKLRHLFEQVGTARGPRISPLEVRTATSLRVAGQEGFEPPTPGFGVRCSAVRATGLFSLEGGFHPPSTGVSKAHPRFARTSPLLPPGTRAAHCAFLFCFFVGSVLAAPTTVLLQLNPVRRILLILGR